MNPSPPSHPSTVVDLLDRSALRPCPWDRVTDSLYQRERCRQRRAFLRLQRERPAFVCTRCVRESSRQCDPGCRERLSNLPRYSLPASIGSIAFREILIFTTIWGICFRSKSNSSGFNRSSSDTVLAQVKPWGVTGIHPLRATTQASSISARPMPRLTPVTGPVPYRERGFIFRFSIGRTF